MRMAKSKMGHKSSAAYYDTRQDERRALLPTLPPLVSLSLSTRNDSTSVPTTPNLHEQPTYERWHAPLGHAHIPQQANIVSHFLVSAAFLIWAIIYAIYRGTSTEAQALHVAGLVVASFLFLISTSAHSMQVVHLTDFKAKKLPKFCGDAPIAGILRALDISFIYIASTVNACADLSVLAIAIGNVNDESSANACVLELCEERRRSSLSRLVPQAYLDPCIACIIAVCSRGIWQVLYGHREDYWTDDIQPPYRPKGGYMMQDDGHFSASLNMMTPILLLWWVGNVPLALATLPETPVNMGLAYTLSQSLGFISLMAAAIYYTKWLGGGTCCLHTQARMHELWTEQRRKISCVQAWCAFPHFHWHVVSGAAAIVHTCIRQVAIDHLLNDCRP